MLTCDITMSLDGLVTDGIESALEQARAAAAGKDVAPILLGGAPGCSTGSARPTWRSSGRSSPRPSPTSATGWSASGSGGLD